MNEDVRQQCDTHGNGIVTDIRIRKAKDGRRTVVVRAECFWPYALHLHFGATDLAALARDLTLTHLPTGCRMCSVRNKAHGKRVIKRLNTEAPELTTISSVRAVQRNRDLQAKAKAIVTETT